MKQWTTGEISKQRNISVRTLRYYDQINLLTPSFKAANGKRMYSEDDLFRLEKIMLLKSLSLPLENIHDVLEKLSYKQVLVSHYNYLQEQLEDLQTSISHTTSLIHMIDLEESLSWERVSELVTNAQTNSKKWIDYFQDDEKALLQKNIPNLSDNSEMVQKYITVLKQAEWCIENNIQAESEEGFLIGTDLIALSDSTFQGDTELMAKFWEVRKLPVEKTGLYPISKEVMEYVDRCVTYATETSD